MHIFLLLEKAFWLGCSVNFNCGDVKQCACGSGLRSGLRCQFISVIL